MAFNMNGDVETNDHLDNYTGQKITVSDNLHAINDGNAYFTKNVIDIDGAETIARFMFYVPNNGKRIHAKSVFHAEAEFLIEIYEGITTSDDGSTVTTFNCNRNSSNTPTLIAYSAPTVTDEGTLIWATRIGSGKEGAGISPQLNYEIIAKVDTKYMFKITKPTAWSVSLLALQSLSLIFVGTSDQIQPLGHHIHKFWYIKLILFKLQA